ncbi:hypothetical protein SteCoe_38010 [Stentor coeruleus]|uniref:RING-CH-type domain-containing protein n=1 Tax=Stentor coeruleus TaxID=5963 RepID=A0A1R2AMB7_9CILI|nr:hypothetical protein SteCoe_38010 [Stentor coeruleus]
MSKVCKICLGEEDQNFISPCNCKGFSQYVHKKCIQRWSTIKFGSMDKAYCEICMAKISLPKPPVQTYNKEIKQYQNAKRSIIGNSIVLISSIIIVVLFFNYLSSSRKKVYFWVLVSGFLCLVFVSLLLLILNIVRICCLLKGPNEIESDRNMRMSSVKTEVV